VIDKQVTPVTRLCAGIGSLFGVGHTPLMPGSAACLAAAGAFFLLKDSLAFSVLTAVSLVLAYLVSGAAERFYGKKDDKHIVIDDFSGQLVTYLGFAFTPQILVSGFFLFRMFDMLKVPPADRLEGLGGSRGIVGDDVVAGIWANLILHLSFFLVRCFKG